jgi:hypothetical protein
MMSLESEKAIAERGAAEEETETKHECKRT